MNATLWTINGIKDSCRASGSHWFDPDTMRFFRCRILEGVYQGPGGIYFVSSERSGSDSPRLYSVRQFTQPSEIATVGDFNSQTRARAISTAKRLAATPLQSQFEAELDAIDAATTGSDKGNSQTKYGTLAEAIEGKIIYLSDGGYTRLKSEEYTDSNGYWLKLIETGATDRKTAYSSVYQHQSRLCEILRAFATDSFAGDGVTAAMEEYQPITVAEQFLHDLRSHGCTASREDARQLRRYATAHHKLMEDYCNGREMYDEEGEPLKPLARNRKRITDIAERIGCKGVKFSGDPRGVTVKLEFADEATNDFGREGWVIPTIEQR